MYANLSNPQASSSYVLTVRSESLPYILAISNPCKYLPTL